MTEREPERWLTDRHANPELRRLLEAGRDERPRVQALRAAPLVIGALLTVRVAAAAAPVAQGAARQAITTGVLKWFAGGVIVGAAALSVPPALLPVQQDATPASQRASSTAPGRASVRPTGAPAVVEPAFVAAEPSAVPVSVPAVRADVAREVALLDAARVALLQGNARRALDALVGLERLPGRALVPEATVLRVRALLALNDVKTARKVAARFVARAPGSPQVPVLRGLFAEPLETKANETTAREYEAAIQTEASEL